MIPKKDPEHRLGTNVTLNVTPWIKRQMKHKNEYNWSGMFRRMVISRLRKEGVAIPIEEEIE